MTEEPKSFSAPVRLAFRVQGDWWVAFLARVDTMEGATELGRILVTASETEAVHEAFKALMRQVMTDQFRAIGIPVKSFDDIEAPESKKAGGA